jgi:CheY-like chemotaxis protein
MGKISRMLERFGIGGADAAAHRTPIRVLLLDDDTRRHEWFERRFKGDSLDVTETATEAIELLGAKFYDAIFLDHDLLPEHYYAESNDDERTGYRVARWLAENAQAQQASTIIVHTRNADGAMRMIELMRRSGRNPEYVPFPMLDQKIRHYWQR